MLFNVSSIGPSLHKALLWIAPGALLFCTAVAQDVGVDIGTDSSIQLVENSEEGSYRFRVIEMTARDNRVMISTVRDDQKGQAELPFEVYESMWRFAMERKVDSMEDAPLENAYPGQSTFDFSFRIGSDTHQFSAYGVDFLTDNRYRELAREIIRIADSQFKGPG